MPHFFLNPTSTLESVHIKINSPKKFSQILQNDDDYFALYDLESLFYKSIPVIKQIQGFENHGVFSSSIDTAMFFQNKEDFLSFNPNFQSGSLEKYYIDKDSILDIYVKNTFLKTSKPRNALNGFLFKSSYFKEASRFFESHLPIFVNNLYYTQRDNSYSIEQHQALVIENFLIDVVNANIISQEALDRYKKLYPSDVLPSAIMDFFTDYHVDLGVSLNSTKINVSPKKFGIYSSQNRIPLTLDNAEYQNFLKEHYKKLFAVSQFSATQPKTLFHHMIPTTDNVLEDQTLSIIYDSLPFSKDSEKDQFMSHLLSKKIRNQASSIICHDSVKYIRNLFNFDKNLFEKFLIKQITESLKNPSFSNTFIKQLFQAVSVENLLPYKDIISTCNDNYFPSEELPIESLFTTKNLTAFEYQFPINKILTSFTPHITIPQNYFIAFFDSYLESIFKIWDIEPSISVQKPKVDTLTGFHNHDNKRVITNHHIIITCDEQKSFDKKLLDKLISQFWSKDFLISLNNIPLSNNLENLKFIQNFARENCLHHKLMLSESSQEPKSLSVKKKI